MGTMYIDTYLVILGHRNDRIMQNTKTIIIKQHNICDNFISMISVLR